MDLGPGPAAGVRAFAAVDISNEARGDCARILEALEAGGADARWTRSENLHLTLRFFGQTPPDRLRPLRTLLDEILRKTRPFLMRLGKLGVFPDARRPRVVWAAVEQGGAELGRMAEELESGARAIGMEPEERPFVPHLTLGRIRGGRSSGQIARLVASLECRSGPMPVEELVLYRSILSREGPVYAVLEKFHLA